MRRDSDADRTNPFLMSLIEIVFDGRGRVVGGGSLWRRDVKGGAHACDLPAGPQLPAVAVSPPTPQQGNAIK